MASDLGSNDPNDRPNRKIRRWTAVVGIFSNRTSLVRLAGAVLAEPHDEGAEGRRYLRTRGDEPLPPNLIDTNPALGALSA